MATCLFITFSALKPLDLLKLFSYMYKKYRPRSTYITYHNNQYLKGIISDSNSIFLWHELKDINKKGYFPNFRWFQFYIYKLCMIMCTGIAP